jgi:hypothetical protein
MIYDVRDLSERLFFEICRRLMLSFTHLHLDEFERDVLFMEDDSNAQSIAGEGDAVEFENHVFAGYETTGCHQATFIVLEDDRIGLLIHDPGLRSQA